MESQAVVMTPAPSMKFPLEQIDFKSNNHLALLNFPKHKPVAHLLDAAKFLSYSPINYALQVYPPECKSLLHQFWFTAQVTEKMNKAGKMLTVISFANEMAHGGLGLATLRSTLNLPKATTYDALPTDVEIISFLDKMKYDWDIVKGVQKKSLSKVERSKMPTKISFMFAHFIQ